VISEEEIVTQLATLPPQPEKSVIAIRPPETGAGNWVGAPTAIRHGDAIFLAYRLRRPIGQGRGYAIAIARSADGENFETLQMITKDQMDTESLERPVLVSLPDGRWRLYLSCATFGTKHWRVEVMEADDPGSFDPATRRTVLPGSEASAVKDPVIVQHDGRWHLWACTHPLADADQTDQMVTEYATSPDGLQWTWHGVALGRRPGEWDSRGVRVSAVRFTVGGVVAFYDGRATAQENYEERTGLAMGSGPAALSAVGHEPVAQAADGARGLRYVSVVDLGDGRERLYYELTRADGSHDLVTELR
jgi:predicted GH43/DUF377 family glycosyl hydrolase